MFISEYGPGSEKSEEEIEEFWNELSECVGSFGRNESVHGSAWGFETILFPQDMIQNIYISYIGI